MTIQKAIETIEANRSKAPVAQAAGIDLALRCLRSAAATSTPASLAEYRGEEGWALAQPPMLEEWDSPARPIAQDIIVRIMRSAR